MAVTAIIKAAELIVTVITTILVALGNWDALAVALPGITGLALAGHHYRKEATSSARGRGRATRT